MLIKAPAKINLHLEVLRKRRDGFHEIYTIMEKVNLFDSLAIRIKEKSGIEVTTDDPSVPSGRDNLAYRAALEFFRYTGIDKGVDIRITKRIPSGAGLGGGSSDAGAVFLGLNKLTGANLNTPQLIDLAKKIGSDVPFFVYPAKAVIAEGRGEILTPIQLPDYYYLLVNPGIHISTDWAYKSIDRVKNILTKRRNRFKILNLNKRSILKGLSNDLEIVCMKRFPVLEDIKSGLMNAGALTSIMSGSGSTIIGIFDSEIKVRRACNLFKKIYWAKIVRGIKS